MKNKELRSALIKSAILLALCIFFIYSLAVTDSGGVTGTISSLFSGAIFLLGLTLALAVSVAILIGVYFGILYLYNKKVCKNTYNEFKTTIADSSESLTSSLGYSCCSSSSSQPQANEEEIAALRNNQTAMNSQLVTVQKDINSLAQTITTVSSSVTAIAEEIHTVANKTNSIEEVLTDKASTAAVDESLGKLTGEITSLQTTLQPVSGKLSELEGVLSSLTKEDEATEDDLKETVDKAIGNLQEEIKAIKHSLESLATHSQEETIDSTEEEPHRILTYFSNKKAQDQFISLVNKAVSKGMTYAQVGEFLNDSLSAANAEIIADHPSLTKDFIRICRQKV